MLKRLNKKAMAADHITAIAFLNIVIVLNVF
jgi:hypothetical protein